MDSNNKMIAGALLFVGGLQFVVAMVVAEAVYPSYSVSGNYISDLGVWNKPSAAIFNPSIILLGLTILVGAYFIQRGFRRGAITSFFVLAGLGPIGVGLFPENTFLVNGVPVLHSIAAVISFIFGGIAAIASYRITKGPFRYFSVILGIATLLALFLFATTGPDYLGIGVGGIERMIVYPNLIWAIGMGANLLSSFNKQ
ncbi:MAG: DUF998 domain-containing protein [Candidatus Bathyarchaeia archaeon]|jgi:hypothetical membrane protein